MDIVNFFTSNSDLFILVVGLLSLVIGSFLNVVIYRLPKMLEQSWSEECRIYLGLKPQVETEKINLYLPFSHCPRCKKVIRPWHNIPVLSYIFLRGRCAYCHSSISLRYPLIELLTCFVSIYVAWRYGATLQCIAALLFSWICLPLTFIDIDHHLLPDQLTLSLLWVGLAFSLFPIFITPEDAIIGAIVGYSIFAFVQIGFGWFTGKIGMGQGDFKFLAAIGTFVGWQKLPLVILLASIPGILIAIIHMMIKRNFSSIPLPFGPYLALSGWITLLWGNDLMHIYLANI